MFPLLDSSQVGTILQQQVPGAFEYGLFLLGSFSIFGPSDFVDHSRELGNDMKEIEDDLDMRDFLADGLDIRVPHIHDHSLQRFPVAPGHLIEKATQGLCPAVLSGPEDTSSLVIQNYSQVAMAFSDGDLVDGQNPNPAGIGLAVLSFQEMLVDLTDGFPVQSQMFGHFLDGQHLAEFVNVEGKPPCHPLAGSEEIEILHNDSLAVRTDYFSILAMKPNTKRSEIQISNNPFFQTVNPSRRSATAGAYGAEALVGNHRDMSCSCILDDALIDKFDSTKRKIICYTQCGHRRPPGMIFWEKSFYPLELPDVHSLSMYYN
jgi:hypothetical protein